MEYVNIITKEAIMRGLAWPPIVIGIIAMLIVIVGLIMMMIKQDPQIGERSVCCAICFVPVLLISMSICTIFFPVETGRYKYTGNLNRDITFVEFAEFQSAYTNIEYKNGLWYWEDK